MMLTPTPRKTVKHVFLAKCRKSLSQNRVNRTTRPYETVHSDVCGPIQVESKGGRKYMLTFTDDFLRYTTAYFIKSKSKVLSKFMEFDALPSQITAGILGRSLQHSRLPSQSKSHNSIERWIKLHFSVCLVEDQTFLI